MNTLLNVEDAAPLTNYRKYVDPLTTVEIQVWSTFALCPAVDCESS